MLRKVCYSLIEFDFNYPPNILGFGKILNDNDLCIELCIELYLKYIDLYIELSPFYPYLYM